MTGTLFIAHRAPWPPDRGDRIRSWQLFRHLCAQGPVHLAALADSEAERAAAIDKLAPMADSTAIMVRRRGKMTAFASSLRTGRPASVEAFFDPRLQDHVAKLLATGAIDRIVCFSGQSAAYVPVQWRGRGLMDFVDVDSAKFEAYAAAGGLLAPLFGWEGRRLAKWEAKVARRVDASLFVSEAEAALFRQRSGVSSRVHVVGNGIDTDYFAPDASFLPLPENRAGLIVFTGQMDYPPNVEAVTVMARDVLPRLSDARFVIVGRAPTAAVRALASPRVEVTGEVPDVRPSLAAADVVAAPLSIARGVQNKLLEAMAMAKPVVASRAALAGIAIREGEHAIAADGAEATASAIAALLADPERATRIGAAARQLMIDRYGWDAQLAPIDRLLAAPAEGVSA